MKVHSITSFPWDVEVIDLSAKATIHKQYSGKEEVGPAFF